MFKNIRIQLARILARDHIEEIQNSVNRRVAETISKMDPFEPLMKEFNGIFSQEYERVEDNLDDRSSLGMKMWGYQQDKDPYFARMTEWIMNTYGNEALKRAPITTERVMYARAQIAGMILLRKETGRLSSLYEEMLNSGKEQEFDDTVSVE